MVDECKRKSLVRFNATNHAHLLTFSCYKGWALLTCDEFRSLLSEGLDNAAQRHPLRLAAFVYMPEHVHLLVYPARANYDVSGFFFAVKRPFSYRVKKRLEGTGDPLLRQLMIRDRPHRTSFRFWQEGGGHDRNIISTEAAIKAAEYFHNNPVRRGLCASPGEWKWSSWKYYHCRDEYDTRVLPEITELRE